MQARVKAKNRWNDVRCQGVEYIKTEWRPVPEADEDAARVNPGLELKAAPKKRAAKRKPAAKKKAAPAKAAAKK